MTIIGLKVPGQKILDLKSLGQMILGLATLGFTSLSLTSLSKVSIGSLSYQLDANNTKQAGLLNVEVKENQNNNVGLNYNVYVNVVSLS